ncbi:uncharacterized protein PAC_03955 [Phialocephala subalpina]|uniref:NACHT domain-containing protein n=1 Tax=Phialocephala subalpina TaxID=576137 RepID=A0A1L7WMS1_9HELO|nr:uncharacterized protein PAC_03955 [Phialocephala subalpina]
MLDPVSTLSVVGTVIQLIDFGTKVATETLSLARHDGGSSSVPTELTTVTTELQKICTKLGQTMQPGVLSTTREASLAKLCDAANVLANELLTKLQGLKAEGEDEEENEESKKKTGKFKKGKVRKWKSFQQAVKTVWNKEAIMSLSRRLSALREMMEMHVLVAVREKLDVSTLQQSKRFDFLDLQTQSIVLAIAKEQEKLSRELETQTQRVRESLSMDMRDQTRAVSQLMSRLEVMLPADARMRPRRKKGSKTSDLSSSSIAIVSQRQIDMLWEDEQQARQMVENAILDDLRFTTMDYRKEEVAETYPETFGWIFEPSRDQIDDDEHLWSNFADWLTHGSGIYWINGKAASGKSTLMRYICEDPRTMTLLRPWASPVIPTRAEFFFWNSGTLDQRSQQGLLRTILFETLQKRRELIPICLPLQWARKYSQVVELFGRRDPDSFRNDSWTLKTLMGAFTTLLQQTEIPLKLCLFVDGLDEYDGDYNDIVEVFKNASSSPHVKICLSSRPLLAFQDAFGDGETLRLQDLTYSDIEHYVSSKLSSHPRYHKVVQEEPIRAPELIDQIVRKADGVFLWVKLVVQSLLSGFGNRDSIKDLQQRLKLMPGDLEHLYSHMFSSISPFYKVQASQYFQLVRTAREQCRVSNHDDDNSEPLTLIELSLAEDDDPDLAITAPIRPLKEHFKISRCELAQARLQVRSMGLLEIHRTHTFRPSRRYTVDPFSRIQYLHRTTRDYIERPEVWANLVAETKGTAFNPHLSLLRTCVLQLKWTIYLAENPNVIFDLAVSYAQTLEKTTGEGRTALLDELDRTMRAKIHACRYDYFVNVAKEHGLHAYVSETQAEACWPTLGRIMWSDVASVQGHLDNGADPNKEHRGTTPWKELLRYIQQAEYHNPKLLDVIKLFLQYGADVDALADLPLGETRSVAAIISKRFGRQVLAECPKNTELFVQLEEANKPQVPDSWLCQLLAWTGLVSKST